MKHTTPKLSREERNNNVSRPEKNKYKNYKLAKNLYFPSISVVNTRKFVQYLTNYPLNNTRTKINH